MNEEDIQKKIIRIDNKLIKLTSQPRTRDVITEIDKLLDKRFIQMQKLLVIGKKLLPKLQCVEK